MQRKRRNSYPPRRATPLCTEYIKPMRIAKPLLLVTTPLGVLFGLLEAWRFHWWLAVLMAVLIGVIGGFVWLTVSRIRRERGAAQAPSAIASNASQRS